MMKPIKQGMLEYNAYLPTTPNALHSTPSFIMSKTSTTPKPGGQSFIPLFEAEDLVDISGIEKEPDLDNTLEVEKSGFGYSEFIKKLGSTEIPNTMSKSRILNELRAK